MMVVKEVQYGETLYQASQQLRDRVLRKPLGLSLFTQNLSGEKNHFHFVVVIDNKLVGTAMLKPNGKSMRLLQVAVETLHQSKGIGKRLICFVEAFAKDKRCEMLTLHARVASMLFYQKLGYQIVGERFTEVGIEHCHMRKKLT